MRSVARYIFRVVMFLPLGLVWVWAVSLIPGLEFEWWLVLVSCIVGAYYASRSVYAWQVIMDNYREENVPGLSRLATHIGAFKDGYDPDDDGLVILTSVNDKGLILMRPHLIPLLRESALVPWENVAVDEVINLKPPKEGELVDQCEDLVAKLKVQDVVGRLEVPWNKEIELFSNIARNDENKRTAKK